ncbi:MAG TPA: hypothetical protein VN822_07660 [Candidatus Acidoferrales bacterium]|nr:hypothetical protein [Candidatus Acidoferrales bacterium]
MWIGILVAVVVVAAAVVFYMDSKGGAKSAAPAAASAAASAAAQANADPVHDLRRVSVKMDKDPSGTVAVWSVDLRNLSQTYGYKDIAYQTTYIGADNSVLLQNTGKITLSLDPGDEQTTTFRDALYPSGTALFKFDVTGATATK